MAKFIVKTDGKDSHVITVDSYTDARHWVINHLDMSDAHIILKITDKDIKKLTSVR